jgi:diguanylate cyclase (GGDEF)-like protein/PAS domain S-box-containing protein
MAAQVRPQVAGPGLELLRRAGEHPMVRSFPNGALIVFDHDLRYLAAGGLGLADVGLSRVMLEGNTIYECFPPDVVDVIEPLYRGALRGDESELDVPFGGRTFLQRIGPVRDEEGTIIAGMGFTQDVTGVREAERALVTSQDSLREGQARLAEAQELGAVGSWECDLATGALTWSDAMLRLYGLDPETFDGDYDSAMQGIHGEDRPAVDAAIFACLETGSPFELRYRILRADTGALRWFHAKGRVLRDGDLPVRLAGAVADVSEQVQAEHDAHEAQAFYTAVLTASPDLTMVIDLETGRMVYGSRAEGLLGLSTEQLMTLSGEDRRDLVDSEDRARLEAHRAAAATMDDGEVLQLRYRGRGTDGAWRWISERVTPFQRDRDGKVSQIVGIVRDVTDVVETEDRLTHAALHDALTGLPNRALLFDRLNAAVERAAREQRVVSELFCDLDGFKQINDRFGHAAGDMVLLRATQRMTGILREGDTLARVGGDEFVAVVEPWNRAEADTTGRSPKYDLDVGLEVANRISSALRAPVVVDGVPHVATASIGIAYTTGPGPDRRGAATADQLVLNADRAMYLAKNSGRDRTVVFQDASPEGDAAALG